MSSNNKQNHRRGYGTPDATGGRCKQLPCRPSRRRQVAARVRAFAVGACLLSIGAAASADAGLLSDMDYRVGNGLRIPSLGLTLGGYATASYESLQGLPARAALDNLSLSVWWEGSSHWKIFNEFDIENGLSSRAAKATDEKQYLALERFYVDYAANELTTVRVGKFLTPIGRWNLLHATPLVWTTSRPLVTTLAFPTNVTGLMVSGSLSAADTPIDYAIYGSVGSEVRPNPALNTFRRAMGTHVIVSVTPGVQLGFSYVSFNQQKTAGEHDQLFGIDFLWSGGGYELTAEAIHKSTNQSSGETERGAFVQLAAPLSAQLHAVGRYEVYHHAQQGPATRLWVTGLSLRVTPAIVLKAEWLNARHNDTGPPQGFLASISVLF